MKLGISLPVGPGDVPDVASTTWELARDVAVAAEANGLDSVWLADHFGMHESWTLLSACAAVTERVELGTIVVCATFRNPGLMANMAATLDMVSGGRLILGIGCGNDETEHRAFGFPNDYRVSRFEEWLEIVVRLLRAETVTFEGRFHQVHEARIEPPPQRLIPTFVAAGGPRMRAITEQWADARLAAWHGAPQRTLDLEGGALPPYTGIVIRYPDQPPVRRPEPYAIVGSDEEVAAVLAEYAALGVEHLLVHTEPISIRSVERLAEAWRIARGLMLGDRGQLSG
ncbi:LLM class flavin-dependent oxidoreductase [Tenggerimyces flavus]|uniref:LLM class flavin-dependent oxidoreductase n=1 Tax=Tenggerimyces flavus TaxID=1708749 RepID=A0ABV7Y9A1_9ACTN|nr:LLM class flavin-dependent oxidoreductase [Tenggerimyces flavus]MBM7786588.1 FMNH2-dependent dimethyl sulfone monooxygenase [Tenggerimyces flavus]